jgi:hypothetical protein
VLGIDERIDREAALGCYTEAGADLLGTPLIARLSVGRPPTSSSDRSTSPRRRDRVGGIRPVMTVVSGAY